MKIAVIGCGWLGTPLAQQFIQAGYEVVGSTTRQEKIPLLAKMGITPIRIRLGEQPSTEHLALLDQVDAWVLNIPPGARKQAEAAQIYPKYLQQIIALARCPILYISSTSVYGTQPGRIIESSITLPNAAGGQAVLAGEQLVTNYDFPSTILRLGGLVGPGRHPIKFLAGRQDLPFGDAPVNLIYLTDVVAAIEAIIDGQLWNKVLHLSAIDHPSRVQFYTACAKQAGLASPKFNPGGADRKWIDASKSLEMLGITLNYPDPAQMPIELS